MLVKRQLPIAVCLAVIAPAGGRTVYACAPPPAASQDIITHTLPLSRYLEGIQMVNAGSDSIKVVLIPPDPFGAEP